MIDTAMTLYKKDHPVSTDYLLLLFLIVSCNVTAQKQIALFEHGNKKRRKIQMLVFKEVFSILFFRWKGECDMHLMDVFWSSTKLEVFIQKRLCWRTWNKILLWKVFSHLIWVGADRGNKKSLEEPLKELLNLVRRRWTRLS